MSFKIKMAQDGILRVQLEGDLTQGLIESFKRDYSPYVEASTREIPLNNIIYMENLGTLSYEARQYLTELLKDERYGLAAFINPPRKARVLGQFIQKATGRHNIRYFTNEKEALSWLKEHKKARTSA